MQINIVCSDFIQRLLKKRFPQMNPFRKNNRVIPKFRGKIISPAPPHIGEKKKVNEPRSTSQTNNNC